MSDSVPRWTVLEHQLKAYQENTDKRLERIEAKLDILQSWADNLQGRFVVLAVVMGIVSPLIVGLVLGLILKAVG